MDSSSHFQSVKLCVIERTNGNEFLALLGTLFRFVLDYHSSCLQPRINRCVVDFVSTSTSSQWYTASPFPLHLPVRGTSLRVNCNHSLQISSSLYLAGMFSTTVAIALSSCFLRINSTSRENRRGRGLGSLGCFVLSRFKYSRIRSFASFFLLVSN